MAVFAKRYTQNVPGKYYVTDQCKDCGNCRGFARNNFRRNDEGRFSYVYCQPTTNAEMWTCETAVAGCPTKAIGNDGDRKPWWRFWGDKRKGVSL